MIRASLNHSLAQQPFLFNTSDEASPFNKADRETMSKVCAALGAVDIIIIMDEGRSGKKLVYSGPHCAHAGLTPTSIAVDLHLLRWSAARGQARWIDDAGLDPRFDLLIAPVEGNGPHRIVIGLLFAADGDFGRRFALETWQRHAKLVAPLIALFERTIRAERALDGCQMALDQCDSAILLINGEGEIVHENRCAQTLLDARDGIQRRGNSVVATQLADAAKLRAAIDHVLADGSASVPLFAVRRADGSPPLLVSITGATSTETETGQGAECSHAAIFICDPARDSTTLLSAVCRLYGLSPVESALACQIVNGVPLSEAAAAMRIKELTARGYLKQIFAKTGVNRQASFVRLMLSHSAAARNETTYAVL
jgi:DNA-binding CsgD family transcriptional regulator